MGNQIKAIMIKRGKRNIQSTTASSINQENHNQSFQTIFGKNENIIQNKFKNDEQMQIVNQQNQNPEVIQAIKTGKLHGTKWNVLNINKYCRKIKVWELKYELAAYDCRQPNIIKQISGIQFPFLKILNLWGNRIETIEHLTQCSFNNLQAIYLWQNNITCIRSLRKVQMPSVTIIDIKNNKISDHSYLTQLNIMKESIKKLHIQCRTNNQFENSDNKWISKMQSKIIYELCLNKRENKIIMQKSINSLLKGSCKRIVS